MRFCFVVFSVRRALLSMTMHRATTALRSPVVGWPHCPHSQAQLSRASGTSSWEPLVIAFGSSCGGAARGSRCWVPNRGAPAAEMQVTVDGWVARQACVQCRAAQHACTRQYLGGSQER